MRFRGNFCRTARRAGIGSRGGVEEHQISALFIVLRYNHSLIRLQLFHMALVSIYATLL